jgi:hypothetical protein
MEIQGSHKNTNIPIVCSYCRRWINKPAASTNDVEKQMAYSSSPKSHGICPACLLHNFPQEYLTIQKDSRLRIKFLFEKGFENLNGKY